MRTPARLNGHRSRSRSRSGSGSAATAHPVGLGDLPAVPGDCADAPVSPAAAIRLAREAKLARALSVPIVDLEELKRLCWNGVPMRLRPVAWQLLTGYLPVNQALRASTLERKRREYQDSITRYFNVPPTQRSEQEQVTLRQILVDVPRTIADVPLFHQEPVQRSMERLLYIWAIRHPATDYVQGINDFVTPLYLAFLSSYTPDANSCDTTTLSPEALLCVEADVYWCLTKLLDRIQDHYTVGQPGLQRMMFRLQELVTRVDAELAHHLEAEGISFLQLSFRWMNCLLMRELPLRSVVRLWDTYMAESDGFDTFHVYVCTAFLTHWSKQLKQLPQQDMLLFLQHLPTAEWGEDEVDELVSQAYVLQSLFDAAPSHLH